MSNFSLLLVNHISQQRPKIAMKVLDDCIKTEEIHFLSDSIELVDYWHAYPCRKYSVLTDKLRAELKKSKDFCVIDMWDQKTPLPKRGIFTCSTLPDQPIIHGRSPDQIMITMPIPDQYYDFLTPQENERIAPLLNDQKNRGYILINRKTKEIGTHCSPHVCFANICTKKV